MPEIQSEGNVNHIDFFVGASEDGASEIFPIRIGDVSLFAGGEFYGANVSIEFSPDDIYDTEQFDSPDDAEWYTQPDGTFDEQRGSTVPSRTDGYAPGLLTLPKGLSLTSK